MELTTTIPKSFWHALSVSVILLAISLCLLMYRSTSLSLEYAGLTLKLSSVLAEAKAINQELNDQKQKLADYRKNVEEARAELQSKLRKADNGSLTQDQIKEWRNILERRPEVPQITLPTTRLQKLESDLTAVQQNLLK